MSDGGGTALCAIDDIEDGGARRLIATVAGTPQVLVAVRRGMRVFVYVNSCPHTGAPLDFLPGRFLNAERSHIQCANHGALFRIEDGHCVHGPCAGGALRAIATKIDGGTVFLAELGVNCPIPARFFPVGLVSAAIFS